MPFSLLLGLSLFRFCLGVWPCDICPSMPICCFSPTRMFCSSTHGDLSHKILSLPPFCFLSVSVCLQICVPMLPCVHPCEGHSSLRCHPQSLSTLVFETGSLGEYEAHQLIRLCTGWLVSAKDLAVSATPALGLLATTGMAFSMAAMGPKWGLHACTAALYWWAVSVDPQITVPLLWGFCLCVCLLIETSVNQFLSSSLDKHTEDTRCHIPKGLPLF